MNRRDHWETVYRTKGDADLSWYQARPTVALSMIESLRPAPASVVDVGGGQSALAGELVARGVSNVTVVDVSGAAIDRARARVGELAGRISWVVADILDDPNLGVVDVWHDRAVFHFLTDSEDRRRYVRVAERTVRPGGHAIVATFGPAGPEKCSGLPVCRYDGAGLEAEFGAPFRRVRAESETHTTPWGRAQEFTYVLLARA